MRLNMKTMAMLWMAMAGWQGVAGDGIRTLTVKTTLRDGVTLAADVYLPPQQTAYPAILIRTPYGKYQFKAMGEFWAKAGYAVAVQDCRGKFDSGGSYTPLIHERDDGRETLDWLARQTWCNGKVGMWGSSYLAYCALVLAVEGHPALKTVFTISGYLHSDRLGTRGGANHLLLNMPWLLHVATQQNQSIDDYDLDELFTYLPLKDAFRSIGVDSPLWTQPERFLHMNRDLDPGRVDIPMHHMTGWMDFVRDAALDIYSRAAAGSDKPQKLTVGPWFHDQFYTTYTESGDVDFGPQSAMGSDKLARLSLEWFDAALKGKDGGAAADSGVRLFLMGQNRWWRASAWPPPEAAPRIWFLDSGRGANSLDGDGRLTAKPNAVEGVDRFVFDPQNPVPTSGGANFHFFLPLLGVKDQRAIEARPDVLVYTSAPFTADTLLAGPVKARLFAATQAPNTDFTAKLVLVREDGYAGILTEGITRLVSSFGTSGLNRVEPGKAYEVEIDMGHTATVVARGQRIRLEVSSSNFPKYDRNPNTGEDPFTAVTLKPAKQAIRFGERFPSRLIIPAMAAPPRETAKPAQNPTRRTP